ncbi:hypothetical protein F4824DRAFT_513402 [Ustulina deusta]|nr:hypothetical protein F4824DRAFT_513402 [Ustulina deusta]
MDFPLEIIDEIIGYLIEHEPVLELSVVPLYQEGTTRTSQWDQFISCDYSPVSGIFVEEEEGQDERSQDEMSEDGISQDEIGQCFTYPWLQHLYSMRLVSRSWNASASRVLRRYWWWPVDLKTTATLERAIQLCAGIPATLNDISTKNLFNRLIIPRISHVRSIEREYFVDQARREGKDLLSIYSDKIVGNVEGLERDDPVRREENRLLRNLIDNLSNVETFSVTFDGAESRYKGHLCMADCYDVVSFGIVMDTILHGLGSQAFQHLTDLRLALPGTHDIGKLAAGIPDNVKQQLKHLYLEVVDESGPGGSLGLSFFDGPSNLQAQYPNQDYQDEVWAFIASCNNLESLGLHCTHCLSLERLNWKPGPNFRGLRALYLNRVYASASTLINLLAARDSEVGQPAARRVEFLGVDIVADGGDWGTVFSWLGTNCPELDFFHVYGIGYLEGHESFAERLDDSCVIWSESGTDGGLLAAIMTDLIIKAGGDSEYPLEI